MLGYLEEAGVVTEHELCPYEDSAGRNRCRITGYALPEDSMRLEIFTAEFVPEDAGPYLDTRALSRLARRAARFFGYVADRDLARFAGNDAATNAARYIADELKRIEDVRVHILTNALVRDRSVDTIQVAGRNVEFSVVDLQRLYRASRAGDNAAANARRALSRQTRMRYSRHRISLSVLAIHGVGLRRAMGAPTGGIAI
jgi:hypothetical protein